MTTIDQSPSHVGCGICCGTMNPCPACGHWCAPLDKHESWEERLDSRRHKGSHESYLDSDRDEPGPAKSGIYSIDMPESHRGTIKYSREFNSAYDGPGKGSWKWDMVDNYKETQHTNMHDIYMIEGTY